MDIEEARRYAKSSHVMKYGPNVSAHFAGPAISMNRAYDSNISSASNPLASEAAAMSAQAMTAAIESSEQVVSALLAEDDTGESNSSQGSWFIFILSDMNCILFADVSKLLLVKCLIYIFVFISFIFAKFIWRLKDFFFNSLK